jgi:hypothetical protein
MSLNNIFDAINILKVGILLSIVALSFVVARSSMILVHPEFATAITIDLTLTLPLAYLFFIRKTKISKLTAIELFVFGIIFASFILPANNQNFLGWIKLFAFPALELGSLGYVGFIFYKSRKTYQSLNQKSGDFLEILRETLAKEFPIALAANALTFEIAVFYYAVISWKAKRGANTFTYHKKSGIVALLSVVMFIVAVETLVAHILIALRSEIFAWILTIISVYFLFQIFAHLKAVFQRPIELTGDRIFLRYGIFSDAVIDLENIEKIENSSAPFEKEKGTCKLALLGKLEQHNLKIVLKDEVVLHGFYGIKRKFKTLYLFVDEVENFSAAIDNRDSLKN